MDMDINDRREKSVIYILYLFLVIYPSLIIFLYNNPNYLCYLPMF
jgi:hypothetical protein